MALQGAQCPLCPEAPTEVVFRRAGAPVFTNVVYADAERATRAARGDIELRHCASCGLLFNAAYDARLLAFDAEYENEQGLSARYLAHLDTIRDRVLELVAGAALPTIVEVGCGQGTLLRRIASRLDQPATVIGIDPVLARHAGGASAVEEQVGQVTLRLFPRRFAAEAPLPPVDVAVIVLRGFLEYQTDPVSLLRALREYAGAARRLVLCLEVSSTETILRNGTSFDLYYEYFTFYSEYSVSRALQLAGFGHVRVEEELAGLALVVEASAHSNAVKPSGSPILSAEARRIADADARLRALWTERMETASRRGKVAVWGAAGKGINFVSMLDPGRRLIDCVVDINPRKQGRFAPCTAHPIVSPEEAIRRGVKTACLLNPNYRDEVLALIARLGGQVDVLV